MRVAQVAQLRVRSMRTRIQSNEYLRHLRHYLPQNREIATIQEHHQMTAPSRPEIIDQHGVVHRHGCPQPGWTVQTVHALPAWCGVRCAGCGAPSLHRSTRLGENQ